MQTGKNAKSHLKFFMQVFVIMAVITSVSSALLLDLSLKVCGAETDVVYSSNNKMRNDYFRVEAEDGTMTNMTNFNQMNEGETMYVMMLYNDGKRFLSFDHNNEGSYTSGGVLCHNLWAAPLDATYFRTDETYPGYISQTYGRSFRFFWKLTCISKNDSGVCTFSFSEYHNEVAGNTADKIYVSDAFTVGQSVVSAVSSQGVEWTISYLNEKNGGTTVSIAPAVRNDDGSLTESGTVLGLSSQGAATLYSSNSALSYQWDVLPLLYSFKNGSSVNNEGETLYNERMRATYGFSENDFYSVISSPYDGKVYDPNASYADTSTYEATFVDAKELNYTISNSTIGHTFFKFQNIIDNSNKTDTSDNDHYNDRHMLWEINMKLPTSEGSTTTAWHALDIWNYTNMDGIPVGLSTDYESIAQRFFIFYSMEDHGGFYIATVSGSTSWNGYYENATAYDGTLRVFTRTNNGSVINSCNLIIQKFDAGNENQTFCFGESQSGGVTIKDVYLKDASSSEDYTADAAIQALNDTTYNALINEGNNFGYNIGTKINSDYIKKYEPENLPSIKVGYKDTGYCTSANAFDGAVIYRFVEPITYTINYNQGTGNEGSMESSVHVYDFEKKLNSNNFKKQYTFNFITNGGAFTESVDDNKIICDYDFLGWSLTPNGDVDFEDEETILNYTSEDGAEINLYAVWSPCDVTLPDIARENYKFYGWSTLADDVSQEDIVHNIFADVAKDTTYYAYWIGVDFSNLKDVKCDVNFGNTDYSISVNVYNENTKQEKITDFGVVEFKWYRLNKNETNSISFSQGADESLYDATIWDRGYAIKAEAYVDGEFFGDACGAFIPSNVLVDFIDPVDCGEANFVEDVYVPANDTKKIEITANGYISKAVFNVNGISYKVYGVWGENEVLLFADGEEAFGIDGGVSRRGGEFDKYIVELTNITSQGLTVSATEFTLLSLPEVFSLVLEGDAEIAYKEFIGVYKKGERAVDGNGTVYFYKGDQLRIMIPVGASYKLAASSYVLVDGVKVFPTYSVPDSEGYVFIDYINEYEYVLKRADHKKEIMFNDTDMVISVNVSLKVNDDTDIHNLNLGPLGVKLYNDSDGTRKLRFGTVWYFDDLATDSSWSRADEKGTYVLPLRNVLKKTDGNHFYEYLCAQWGEESAREYANDFQNKYDSFTSSEKETLISYLSDFIQDWNIKADAQPGLKISFGEDVAADIDGKFYFYQRDDAGRYFIEYSAVITNIKEENLDTDLVYFPYASYVANWGNGFLSPPSEDEYANNIYLYKAPATYYTYNGASGQMTINDIFVPQGSEVEISPMFTSTASPVAYYYSGDAITIKEGKIVANKAGEIVNVTAVTKYNTVKFTVSTVGALVIDDMYVPCGQTAKIDPLFTDGMFLDITYEYDDTYIDISVDGVITAKVPAKRVLVVAKTLYHTVEFYVEIASAFTIEDIELVHETTLSFSPVWEGDELDITYIYDEDVLLLDAANKTVYAKQPGKTVVVTAEAGYFTTTFTVKTFENPETVTVSSINVYDYTYNTYKNPTTDFYPTFTNTSFTDKYAFNYDYDTEAIKIDSSNNTVVAPEDCKAGTYTVKISYKNMDCGSFTVNVIKADEKDEIRYNDGCIGYTEYTEKWETEAKDGKTTLFIGDSFFDSIYWSTFYDAYKTDDALLLGISGSTTYDWEKIVMEDGYWLNNVTKAPKNIVMNIGTNNTCPSGSGGASDNGEQGILALQRMLLTIHERFPDTKIYWFQISYRNDYGRYNGTAQYGSDAGATIRSYNDEINSAMAIWCSERDWVDCVATAYAFTDTELRDGVHPKADMYYYFTQTVGLNVDVLLKDVSYTTHDTSGQTTMYHTGWTLGKDIKYVIWGTIEITNIDESVNPFVQFGFNTEDTDNFVLYYSAETGTFDLCFKDMISDTPYKYKIPENQSLVLDWKIVYMSNDIYFYIRNNDSMEYELKLVKTGLSTPNYLILASHGVECTFRDMSVRMGIWGAEGEEYNEEISKPEVLDSGRTYGWESGTKYIVFSEPENEITEPSTAGFEQGEWIWRNGGYAKDEYAEFYFEFDGGKNVEMKISVDSNYAVYINGKLAAFSQYADYPYYKIYDTVDISQYCTEGKNRCGIIVYYCGSSDFSTYYKSVPGLIFEVESDGVIVAKSDVSVMSRLSNAYVNKAEKKISLQLGFSFKYLMEAEDDWLSGELEGFSHSVSSPKRAILYPRPIEKTELLEKVESNLEKTFNDTDGYHYIFDLEKEQVGFIDFDIYSSSAQSLTIVYGEHLTDGVVRNDLWMRDFSVEIDLRAGSNVYMNPFLRLGCRYLEVISSSPIEINYVSIRPVVYPVEVKEPTVELTEIQQKIYDISVYTLICCMHEHYEDCPWREQAMYAMDSRNQMLCGYYAFGEYEFPRACIRLMAESVTEDGLMTITHPNGGESYIPSFNLHYFLEIGEYIDHSEDITILPEIWGSLETILDTFIGRIDSTGLVPVFEKVVDGNDVMWDFYEWTAGMSAGMDDKSGWQKSNYDLALNCLLVSALEEMVSFCEMTGDLEKRDYYLSYIESLRNAINDKFYDSEKGLYVNDDVNAFYSQFGNSLAILCGAADETIIENIAYKIANDSSLTQASLSTQCFVYDALLKADFDGYKDYIIEHIDSDYKSMVDAGATTFWETLEGDDAFGRAGSLCHGWSAMPIYYYNLLLDPIAQ